MIPLGGCIGREADGTLMLPLRIDWRGSAFLRRGKPMCARALAKKRFEALAQSKETLQ
jgi:hypothetical protein